MTENYRSLSHQAYEQIKQRIVSLELSPGSVIDESRLQTELDLGRTPIREALRQLSHEKLVTIIPRRGIFVTEIGIVDLHRLCEVRVELEGLAARLAAQRGSMEHWQQMAAILDDVAANHEAYDNETLVKIDQRCHEIIYDAAGNEFLKDTLVTLYSLSLRLWYFALSNIDNMHEGILEHVAIMEALKAAEADLAADLSQQHVYHFQEEIQGGMLG